MSEAKVHTRIIVNSDDDFPLVRSDSQATIANVLGERDSVALANGFNAFTVPTGAKGLMIIVEEVDGTVPLTLKGVTGDTGITVQVGTNDIEAPFPILLPLGTTPVVGITAAIGAGESCTVTLIWL